MKKMLLLATLTAAFFSLAAQSPTISSFTPTSGPIGTTVIIIGTNFSPNPTDNVVYFGAVKAPVISASPTTLRVTVPTGATYRPITVTVNGLTGYAETAFVVSPALEGLSTPAFEQEYYAVKTSYPDFIGVAAYGDVDGNGKVDIVAVSRSTSGTGLSISVYRNNSTAEDFSFAPELSFQVDYNTENINYHIESIMLIDLDGDGAKDLIAKAVAYLPTVTHIALLTFKNLSTIGTFAFAPKVELPFKSIGTTGDLNGDGKPEVVVNDNDTGMLLFFTNTSTSSQISFSAGKNFGVEGGILSIDDLDGDGKNDLITRFMDYYLGISSLSLYRNTTANRVLSFTKVGSYQLPAGYHYSASLTDLDGNGKPDFTITLYNSIAVYRNTSTIGVFSLAPAVTFPTSDDSYVMALGDLDGDGKPDAVTANRYYKLSVLRNKSTTGSINFAPFVDYEQLDKFPLSAILFIGDLNGDSKPEVAINEQIHRNTSSPGAIGLSGRLIFETTTFRLSNATIQDLDGDGKSDLVFSGDMYSASPEVLRNLSSPSALAFERNNVTLAHRIDAVADMNGDGKPDLIGVDSGENAYTIHVLQNTSTLGEPSFATKADYPTTTKVTKVLTGDLDGDGRTDIIVSSKEILRNTSTGGTFSFEKVIFETEINATAVGDLNGDGKPELIGAGTNSVVVLPNTSTAGNLSFAQELGFPGSGGPVLLADLNGDGKPDLVQKGTKTVSVLQNTTTGVTTAFMHKQTITITEENCQKPFCDPENTYSLVISDMDGNGKPDLVATDISFSIFVFYNISAGEAIALAGKKEVPYDYSYLRYNSVSLAIGDLDGDNLPELVDGTTPAWGREASANFLIFRHKSATTAARPSFLNNNQIVLDASCKRSDGSISIIPTSGTAPFMYSIDGGATYVTGPANGFTFQNLAPGTYQLRIKDANGCESAVVTRQLRSVYGGPTFLNDGTIVRDASCGMNDGNITIVPTSGTAPFQYSIDDGVTYVAGPASGYTFANLAAGNYWLRLKDANGCESQSVLRFVRPNAYGTCATSPGVASRTAASSADKLVTGIAVYPNPSKGQFRMKLGLLAAERVQVTVLDGKGTIVQQRQMGVSEGGIVELNLSGKAKGLYLIKVVSEKGTQVAKVVVQ